MKSEAAATAANGTNRRQQPSSIIPVFAGSSRPESLSYYEEIFSKRVGMAAACYYHEIEKCVPQIIKALQIRAGDEIIVSCLASRGLLAALEATGVRPVLADVDPANLQLCSWAVDAAVTSRTRAVVATHLHGIPCNMLALLGVTASHDICLIEDCTQATGARVLGRPVGSFGEVSLFSCAAPYDGREFSGSGVVALRNAAMRSELDDPSDIPLTALEAASLYDDYLFRESRTERRRHTAEIYTDILSTVAEVQLPNVYEDSQPSWGGYVVRVQNRDGLLNYLWEKGIHGEPVQPPPDSFGPVQRMGGRCHGDCYAHRAAMQGILLPVPDDLSEDEAYSVCCEIRSFYDEPNRSRKVVPVPGTTVERMPEVNLYDLVSKSANA